MNSSIVLKKVFIPKKLHLSRHSASMNHSDSSVIEHGGKQGHWNALVESKRKMICVFSLERGKIVRFGVENLHCLNFMLQMLRYVSGLIVQLKNCRKNR